MYSTLHIGNVKLMLDESSNVLEIDGTNIAEQLNEKGISIKVVGSNLHIDNTYASKQSFQVAVQDNIINMINTYLSDPTLAYCKITRGMYMLNITEMRKLLATYVTVYQQRIPIEFTKRAMSLVRIVTSIGTPEHYKCFKEAIDGAEGIALGHWMSSYCDNNKYGEVVLELLELYFGKIDKERFNVLVTSGAIDEFPLEHVSANEPTMKVVDWALYHELVTKEQVVIYQG